MRASELMSEINGRRKLRIAVFSKIPIAPANGGNRSHIRSICKELICLGCEVKFFLVPSRQLSNFDLAAHNDLFGEDNFEIIERSYYGIARDFCKLFLSAVVVRNFHRFLRKYCSIKLLRRNVDYLYPAGIERSIASIAKQNRYDVILVQYVHFSRIFASFDASVFKVLQTHDSFHNEFYAAAEATGFRRADRVLAIQDEEASRFRDHLGPDSNRVEVLSHVIEIVDKTSIARCDGATFVGSDMAANRKSIDFFLHEIFPIISSIAPSFKLFVVGSICHYIKDQDRVVKEGIVPELGEIFAKAPILINSIVDGTGVKIKLLDALGYGISVVSTELGVKGIEAEFLEGVRVAPDSMPDIFAKHVVELFNDYDLVDDLGSANRKSAEKWNALQINRLKHLIKDGEKFMPYRE